MSSDLLLIFGTIILFIVVCGFIVSRLYKRSTKDLAYVRTGRGGQVIILNNSAFVLPVLHKAIPVSLSTKLIEVSQFDEAALITRDRLRANIAMVFYVKIKADEASIATAAQILGTRTLNASDLKALLDGKLIDAIRRAAAEFTLSEIQQDGLAFMNDVQGSVEAHFVNNGLALEAVSIKLVDQSDKDFMNPGNVFDAEGLTKLAQLTEVEKKKRNEIEQAASLEIRQKQLECERLVDEMEKQKLSHKLGNERDMAEMRAKNEIEKSKEEVKCRVHASISEAEIVRAEEQVITIRELAKVERQKQIDLLEAKTNAEIEAMAIRAKAAAENSVAADNAETSRISAQAKSDAFKIVANGKNIAEKTEFETVQMIYEAHAQGVRSLIEAFNPLSDGKIPLEMRMDILDHLPKIPYDQEDKSGSDKQKVLTIGEDIGDGRGDLLISADDSDTELDTVNESPVSKSSKIRNILNDAHKSVLMEAVSTLNKMSGGSDNVNTPDQQR